MDVTDLKKKITELAAKRTALIEKKTKMLAEFNLAIHPIGVEINTVTDAISILDKAIRCPKAAASIAGFLLSQTSQPDSGPQK